MNDLEKAKSLFSSFFDNLAERKRCENDLSDVIAAACNTSKEFANFFLKFMFGQDLDTSNFERMKRENSTEKGRIDLITDFDGKTFSIENKIYDENDHYNEYSKEKRFGNVGFIANYDISGIKYNYKHTWEEFCKELEKKAQSLEEKQKDFFFGILTYIKGVCLIMEERQFNPDKTQDLSYVMELLEKAINEAGLCQNSRKKDNCNGYYSGYYYGDPNNDKKEYWVGLWHDGTEKNHNFWIQRFDWNKKDNDEINLEYGKFYDNEEYCAWFCLKNEYFNDIVGDKKDFKDKFEIIKGFIKEVAQIK